MEIERKYLIHQLPPNLESYPRRYIEQAYLNIEPVVRVRKDANNFFLTFKGPGMMAREEVNVPLDETSYYHLRGKADGQIISKYRYNIPLLEPQVREGFPKPPNDYRLLVELDVFLPPYEPLLIAEVEFGSIEAAEAFLAPSWFGEDVTYRREYHNSYLALHMERYFR
ncbi:MAG: CYTH domain-containing protein [Lachnospiraceae bacterium]|jgi:CYTH domain-containing protein|nr:CYTH domain-containing protein [Lachnospiraceae bacterium]